MREFTLTDTQSMNVTFEGVLFADGTVVLHALPPSRMTLIHLSLDEALNSLHDRVEVTWLNDAAYHTDF
jgi:hypothetical protein